MNAETIIKEELIRSTSKSIVRVKLTSAGFVVEINESDLTKEQINSLIKDISSVAWNNYQEIIYSFYGFSNNEQRFSIEATLREKQTDFEFNMSTSYLGAHDIFCRFTRFDFDVLTLSGPDEETIGLFIIDDSSPCRDPQITYRELDIQGHQFAIKAKPEKLPEIPNVYSIKLFGGDHRS